MASASSSSSAPGLAEEAAPRLAEDSPQPHVLEDESKAAGGRGDERPLTRLVVPSAPDSADVIDDGGLRSRSASADMPRTRSSFSTAVREAGHV